MYLFTISDPEDEEIEEVDSDEWDEDEELNDEDVIPNMDCLFCTQHSKNTEKNLLHMSENHSFFVPDLEFVADLDGMISYLGAKVIKKLLKIEILVIFYKYFFNPFLKLFFPGRARPNVFMV